jgi:hypothetical protein
MSAEFDQHTSGQWVRAGEQHAGVLPQTLDDAARNLGITVHAPHRYAGPSDPALTILQDAWGAGRCRR